MNTNATTSAMTHPMNRFQKFLMPQPPKRLRPIVCTPPQHQIRQQSTEQHHRDHQFPHDDTSSADPIKTSRPSPSSTAAA